MDRYETLSKSLEKRGLKEDLSKLKNSYRHRTKRLKEQYKADCENNLKQEDISLDFTNKCIAPFQNDIGPGFKKTGYFFIGADPLYGMTDDSGKLISNFDIMLFEKELECSILIECKSSITNISRDIQQVNNARQSTIDKLSTLSEFVKSDLKEENLDYVIAMPSDQWPEHKDECISNDIIPWSVNAHKRKIYIPDPDICELHNNDKIANHLQGGIDIPIGSRLLTFLPSSNNCRILQQVCNRLMISHKGWDEFIFSPVEVYQFLRAEEYNFLLSDTSTKRKSEKILGLGEKLDILEKVNPSKSWDQTDYRLKLKSIRYVEPTIKDQYIKQKLKTNQDIEKIAKEDAYNEYISSRKKITDY